MKLLSLEVHNFCQHRHKEVEFHNRLNAFLGHNGSGKSNLLVSALGALTGDFSRTNGKKVENICQFADDDEPSYVKLKFEHNGTTATVQRGLRGKQSYFQLDHSYSHADKIRGDKAASAAVADLLGVSTQMLNQYVFVEQGEIFAPLAAKPAERARSFQKLFGVSQAEKCWEAVGSFLIEQRRSHVLLPNLDHLQSELAESERDLGNCDIILATQFPGISGDYIDAEDPDRIRITSHNQWTRYDVEAGGKHEKLQGYEVELLGLAEVCARARQDRDNYVCLVDEGRKTCEETKEVLAAQTSLRAEHDKRQRLQQRINTACLEEEANPEPTPPEGWVPLDELSSPDALSVIDELKIEQRKCDHLLAYFADPESAHHKAECPTCGTHVDDIDVDADELRTRLGEISNELADFEKKIDDATEHRLALVRWNGWRSSWEKATNRDQEEYGQLPEPGGELLDHHKISENMTFVDEYDQQVILAASFTGEYDKAVGVRGYTQRIMEDLLIEIEAITRKRDEHARMTQDEVQEAEERCAHNRSQHYRRIEAANNAAIATEVVTRRRSQLTQAQEAAASLAHEDVFYTHLESVRTLLHRDNLPRIVAQNYLELLETDTNELLTLFDTDYQIRAIEGMGFEVLFEDGRIQPATRLSGGQKVVLALAFRIAVNSMFANDLSLLCLDEPTAYLDDDNLGCLSVALGKLRDLSGSRGLQCVLITHENSLGHLFDNVVQL
jgi:DNA repair exonuclease SbcCD ATPase subunit